ncbi:hypothetical protein, partial [Xanthomonas perforans]
PERPPAPLVPAYNRHHTTKDAPAMSQDPYAITFNDGPRLLFVYAQPYKPNTRPVSLAEGGDWIWLRVDTITQIMSPLVEQDHNGKTISCAVVVLADGLQYHVAQTPLSESDVPKAQSHLIDRVGSALGHFGPRR